MVVATLRSIKLSNYMKSISYDVFDECTKLTSILLYNSIIAVTNSAFGGRIKLKKIAIPSKMNTGTILNKFTNSLIIKY